MASQGRRGGVSLPDRPSNSSSSSSIISRISRSPIVSRGRLVAGDAGFVAKKLLKSTGKAAWIVGTSFLILVVPLIIEMDREQQLNDLELQQASLLGTPSATGIPPPI
ncbi:mitochondrial import receptor subunit TOM9-2 [Lotus japonicus]|uniref:mitochondrial import receptor subunit TOM9-2 n=1 Tax=Lotus japonicus TaxID=34305 RepID=UPI0025837979|nr:mitochondrial import receptor subunit TOM9-2 [Lotus japonicus]